MIRFASNLVAALMVATGLYLLMFGNAWAPAVLGLLAGSGSGAWLELLVPFLPMVCIGSGAALFTSFR